MRIAFFTDIHANREAFAACLDHAGRGRIDRHVFLGDYVGYGADPVFALDTVMDHVARGAAAVVGNHDAAVLVPDRTMNGNAFAAMTWTRRQLGPGHAAFIGGLPLTSEEDGRLYVHASAASPERWPYIADVHAASQCLAATPARVVFCGHTHVPTLFHLSPRGRAARFTPREGIEIPLTGGRRWLAVIGSVGQPRDNNPAACYAVFDAARGALTYFRVPYDVAAAAAKISAAGLPAALSDRLFLGR